MADNSSKNAGHKVNQQAAVKSPSKKKLISTTVIGNIVEYYDFGIYAVFAPKIGSIFFPSSNEQLTLLLSFIVFAIGFIMRPLGGLFFGHIGDKLGRKVALRLSISGMAVSTMSIALLPGYETIGIVAPILLVLVRLLQGLCIGGEGTGSAIYILEHMAGKKLSLVGSVVMASNSLGTLIAYGVGIAIDGLFGIDDITWRYGFVLGSIAGLIGAYFRSKNSESPVFHDLKERNATKDVPIYQVFKKKKFATISVIVATGAAVSISYLIRGYINSFYTEVMNYSARDAMYITCFALSCVVIFLPIFGFIADKIGYNHMLMTAAFCIAIWSSPQFALIADGTGSLYNNYMGVCLLSLLCAAMCAPLYPYAIQSFPPELRYSGVSLSYNLGNALFGGTTPLICTLFMQKFGTYGPAYYITGTAGMFIVVNFVMMVILSKMRKKNSKKNSGRQTLKDE